MNALNEEEIAGFGKYLAVQYPNEENALKVFRYYKRFFPERQHPGKMDLSYAFKKIYQKESDAGIRDQKRIWNAFSKLYQWLKEYLVLEKMRSDRFVLDMLWLNVLQEKKLNTEYGREVIKCHGSSYYAFYDVAACLKEITFELHFKEQLTMPAHKPDDATLHACLWKVEKAAELIRLKMECERLSLYKVMSYTPGMEETKPLLQIYQKIHELISEDKVAHYFDLEKLVHQFTALIPPAELNIILRTMQNFTSRMTRREGDSVSWALRYHELNKSLLAKDVVAWQNNMTAANFQNIVNVACIAADFEWIHQFMADYSPYLPQKIRDENLFVAQAAVAFEQKDYKKVIMLTQKPVFKDERHVLRFKLLHLRALYELDMDLTDHINSFKTFLKRHRNKETYRNEAALSFMHLFNMLFQRRATKEEMLKTLEQNPNMYCRPWIQEKIGKYKQVLYR
ncbi:MAG: hypothetical protein IT261_05820 [Saprospiraceae bacterium]|nr:hypothetical protein [Saprospiraceae bacterium]